MVNDARASSSSVPTHALERFPTRLVPSDVAPMEWAAIDRLGRLLLERSCTNPIDLERWLEDVGELTAWVTEAGTRRRIAMMLHMDDPEAERAHLEWVREIEPKWERLDHWLMRAYLDHHSRKALSTRYRVFDRATEARHALYREANLPLFVTEAEAKQAYQKRWGAMTVVYQGREYALPEVSPLLASPDPAERQAVWDLRSQRMLADRDAIDGLFDDLLRLRTQIARNADCPSYREYAFRALRRFDYTSEDCARFHDAVEAHFVPLATRVAQERCRLMGLPSLRPWDTFADPFGRESLRAPDGSEELLDRCERTLRKVAPDFGDCLRQLRDAGLIDLESRKGKAPGSWQLSLPLQRAVFIFINAGPRELVRVLFHELGHAVHWLLARHDPLMAYREPPMEFEEVASYGMELFTAPHLASVYERPEDAARAYRQLLDLIVIRMPWIAAIDALQHWMYTHPDHSAADRRTAWTQLYQRFHPGWADWSGHHEALGSLWQAQTHVFLHPFYYIEYGIAEIAALDLWRRATNGDRAGAVAGYRTALSHGGSRPLPELFAAAGLRFAFDAEMMAPLAGALGRALDELPYDE